MGLLSLSAAAPLAAGVLAALAASFKPALASALVSLAREKPGRCLGWGTVFGLGSGLVAGVLMGTALRAVGGGTNLLISCLSLSLFSILIVAGLCAAAVSMPAVGTLFKLSFLEKPFLCVAAGFAALSVAGRLPWIGELVQFAAVSWGAGALILRLRGELP